MKLYALQFESEEQLDAFKSSFENAKSSNDRCPARKEIHVQVQAQSFFINALKEALKQPFFNKAFTGHNIAMDSFQYDPEFAQTDNSHKKDFEQLEIISLNGLVNQKTTA